MNWESFPSHGDQQDHGNPPCCQTYVATGRYEIRRSRFGVYPYTTWFWRPDGVMVWIGTFSTLEAAKECAERDDGRGISQRKQRGFV
jgi:hypothetical protein